MTFYTVGELRAALARLDPNMPVGVSVELYDGLDTEPARGVMLHVEMVRSTRAPSAEWAEQRGLAWPENDENGRPFGTFDGHLWDGLPFCIALLDHEHVMDPPVRRGKSRP